MGTLFTWPGKKPPQRPQSAAMRSLFHNFRLILEHNTDALSLMAGLERALGGEYIFDRAFLEKSVRELDLLVQRVVYRLNNLTGDRYLALFDRYQTLKGQLDDALAGGPDPASLPLVVSFTDIGLEAELAVGQQAACLAELKHRFGLPAQDGFAVTTAGVRALTGLKPDAALPAELDAALRHEAEALFVRRGRACPLSVTLWRVGPESGQDAALSARAVAGPDGLPRALLAALGAAGNTDDVRAFSICEAPEPALSGLVRTLFQSGQMGQMGQTDQTDQTARPGRAGLRRDALLVNVFPAGTSAGAPSGGDAERHLMRRSYPFRPMRSELLAKPVRFPHADGSRPLSLLKTGLLRGTALLPTKTLGELAEAAMAVERVLNAPQELGWVLSPRGRLLFTSVRPLARLDMAADMAGGTISGDVAGLDDFLAHCVVLAHGGGVAQAGVGAGRVVHVADSDDPEAFPLGAVAVARVAAPRLSPFLRRASALVTEVGTAVGHLATIAREYRVPALFGLPGALALLPAGEDVTVDASAETQGTVYRGILEPLLSQRAFGPELDPGDPEYALLRRVLRLVRPLNLLDPEAPEFTPAGCRSYHDLIHFAHEKAVEELAEIHARQPDLRGAEARRLKLSVPMDIRVLDIGEGVAEDASETVGGELGVEQLSCAPLTAFLRGLCSPGAWRVGPADLRAADVLGGLRKTFELMSDPSGVAGQNLAIVARGYLNLSLRLGYHFSVVDAHLGDNPNQNSIYFRFVGGLADEERRARRARLIRVILEGLGFQVMVEADLVVGKFKVADRPEMESVLARLGELTAFTRQLDTGLASDAEVLCQAQAFLGLPGVEAACATETRPSTETRR